MQLLLQCMDACCASSAPAHPASAPAAPCCRSSASTPSAHAPPPAPMGDLGLAGVASSYQCASQACGFDLGWDAVPCADPGCATAPCTDAGCVGPAPPPHSDSAGLPAPSNFMSPPAVPGSSACAPAAPPAAPPTAAPPTAAAVQADHSTGFPFNMPLNEMLLHICCSDHSDQSAGLPLTLSSTGATDWLALASNLGHASHGPQLHQQHQHQHQHQHQQDVSHPSAAASASTSVHPQAAAHGQATPGPLDLLRSVSTASAAAPSQMCNDFSFPSAAGAAGPSHSNAQRASNSAVPGGMHGEQLLLDPVLFDPSTVCTSPSCLDPAWLFFDAPHGSCTMDQPHVHQAEPDLDDPADDDDVDDLDEDVGVANDPEASQRPGGALDGLHPSSTCGPTPSAPSGGVFECQWGACRAQYRSAHRLIEHVQRKHLDLLLPQAVVDKTSASAALARRGRRRKVPAPHVHPRPHAHFHPPHGDVLHPHLVLHNAPPHLHQPQPPAPRPAGPNQAQSPAEQHAHAATDHTASERAHTHAHAHAHSHPHPHPHSHAHHAHAHSHAHPHVKSEKEMPPPALGSTEGQITPPHPDKRESVPPLDSTGASPSSSRPPTPGSERSPAALRVGGAGAGGEVAEGPEKHACCWGTCTAQFDTLDELNSHLSQEHVGSGKSSYRCEWRGCTRAAQGEEGSFKQRQKLQRHLQTHTNFRPFVCTVCNAAFGEATGLALHMRTHSGQRPFACDWPGCDKRFATSGSLVNHLRVHRGDRPFACPICGRAFAEASNLSKHKKTHTGEKRYACRVCNKFYARSDQLARHMRGHEMKAGEDGEPTGVKRSPTPLDRAGSTKRAHLEA